MMHVATEIHAQVGMRFEFFLRIISLVVTCKNGVGDFFFLEILGPEITSSKHIVTQLAEYITPVY